MPELIDGAEDHRADKRRAEPTPTIAARPTSEVTPVAADDRGREERAHHEDLAVGEVDQLDDAVDERVAERDQRDQRAVGEPDDQELGEECRS